MPPQNRPPPPTVRGTSLLSRYWLQKVAATPENDLRGHRVALTYSLLAPYLDGLIHGDTSEADKSQDQRDQPVCNANWFHFAMWGTLTVTRNVANERPPQRIDTVPFDMLRRRLTPALIQLRASSGQRVGRALSWGQRLIFVSVCFSLGYLARWLADHPEGDPNDFDVVHDPARPTAEAQTIESLGSWGEHWWRVHERQHVGVITEAFRLYIHARQTTDPDVRARCILGANVLLTAVEQDLVNPAIKLVINHIPDTVASALDERIAAWAERWMNVPRQVTSLQLPFRYLPAREAFDTAWSRLMTDQVLVMALPTETLRLGRDIPWRQPGQPYFPPALQRLEPDTAPADGSKNDTVQAKALQQVAELIASLDRTVGDGRGSAARDWRRWDERMNFVVTLMRSRQQDESLFWSPYSTEDQERIVRGHLPRRSGDPSAKEVQPPIGDEPFVGRRRAAETRRRG